MREAPTTIFQVTIMRERCQGHGRCVALAPTIFGLDGEGNGEVVSDLQLTPELLEQARLAQANCPEGAVRVKKGTI